MGRRDVKYSRLKPPCFVEVAGIDDLARLACAFERAPIPVFCFNFGSDMVHAVQLDIYRGMPILYYLRTSETGQFLGYRNTGGGEAVGFSGSATDPTYIYAPVIGVERPHPVFKEGFTSRDVKRERYTPMQLKDVSSLAKVALYKIIFEESPLPLFTFPYRGSWELGAFARMDEADEASIFFYVTLSRQPEQHFIRYSNSKPEKAGLTDRIDEPGYLYAKIVRLLEPHPLVEL